MSFNVSFNNKDQDSEDLMKLRDIADDVIEHEFIPYACHFSPDTILTKNGELMQTIKIVGFSFEMIDSEGVDLRETIRQAVHDGMNSDDFAVWFHTIRRRKNLNPGGQYPETFSNYVHDAWKQRHDWEHKYINELFITVVRDGETGSIKHPKRFMRGLFPAADHKHRVRSLQQMHNELNTATDRMLNILRAYGARRLTTFEDQGTHYSEPMRFLTKILKLREEEVPVPDMDLSHHLGTYDVTFGFDCMEVRDENGLRRFGAMLTVKEYRELSLASIDEFLQLPEEFIITQSMDFINNKKALENFKFQHYVLGLSNDQDLAEISGLNDIVESNHDQPTDYGEHQLTIFLLADDIKHLNRYVERTVGALASLGIVAMREDLRLEESYWAQLPGNFEFLKRLRPINASRIAGFANLSNFPAGKEAGNYWGPAVTIFNTAAHTPYFFNFHIGNVGHTTIIGPYGAGKTVLMNFLLCEARKFQNKLFFFDQNRGSELFIRALGGNYAPLSFGQPQLKMNPLQLEDSPVTRDFLSLWIEALVSGYGASQLNAGHENAIEKAIADVMPLDKAQRNLEQLANALSNHDPALAKLLTPWYGEGSHAALFGHAEDNLDLSNPVYGFDMTEVVRDKHSVAAALLYLLHRVTLMLDGTPTIIVLDEAWDMMDNPIFAPRLHGWLDALTQRNALAIFATESVEDASQSVLSQSVFADIATQIYLPNEDASEAYQTVFGLNDMEYSFLELMDPEERHFLLKKGGEAIVAKLSLDGMDNIMSVLSTTPENLRLAYEVMKEKGMKPDDWVPVFMERAQEGNGLQVA